MPILKQGSTGSAVTVLQQQLNRLGFALEPDGWFGEATRAAVRAFQRQAGLLDDGKVGPVTREALQGILPVPRRLNDADLQAAADALGVDLAAVKAVIEVESRGSGFEATGHPVILFERHVFYRQAKVAGLDAEALASRYPNLCSTRRGGYAGGPAEWSRYRHAGRLHPDCAVEAASWGLFQIMGFHWQALGYPSAAGFAGAMAESSAQQLDAFVRFVRLDPALLKALKGHQWAAFARRYNGPAYQDNLYDVKLARAHARYAAGEVAA
ncbi:N-acetylmuramidase family protein [Laribacter hongkongensis]|uniref:N-acetylmuramidase domain-containing protein n=1 Tax=Laribacter hongkongensis TaxID=168471 RepID=UPI001EFCEF02|nr:N-acetylmuramidase family protein [Laribacter hongkongensis]MCG9005157.1 N-acetylmuramidase family protein [Laribacter hongkongensis]